MWQYILYFISPDILYNCISAVLFVLPLLYHLFYSYPRECLSTYWHHSTLLYKQLSIESERIKISRDTQLKDITDMNICINDLWLSCMKKIKLLFLLHFLLHYSRCTSQLIIYFQTFMKQIWYKTFIIVDPLM